MFQAALQHGPWVAAMASLAVTPVGYAAIAAVLERRLLRTRSEYVALIYGDILLALSIALGVWLLHGQVPDGIARPPFSVASTLCWLGFGLAQWRGDVRSGLYTRSQACSPTKIWHQLVVYPVLGYWTWAACIGGLLAPGGSRPALPQIAAKAGIVVCVTGWVLANVYDRRHPKLGHPPYDWRGLHPQPRPWPPQSISIRLHAEAAAAASPRKSARAWHRARHR